jgi:hypothetical protein
MIPPRGWTRGFGVTAATLVVAAAAVMATTAGVAHAEAAFRKKKAPSSDASGTEASPSGGETSGEIGNSTEGGEAPAPKGTYVPQAEDKDRPHDPALLAPTPADAALAKKAKKEEGPPFYTKWQFWAITGGVVVGAIAAIWAGSKLVHEMGGGDVRGCNRDYSGCFGEGH